MDQAEESRQRTLAAIAAVNDAMESGEHFVGQLQMRDVRVSADTVILDMAVTPALCNSRGALQGGLLTTLVDIAAGRLAMAGVEAGHSTATIDLNSHFLAPIVTGPARATATIVRTGKRTVVVRVDVEDVGRDRLAATATVQFVVLEPLV